MIDRFNGEYAFLSNFHPSTVKLYGRNYPTVEHAFQAAKTLSELERTAIRHATTPGRAKRLGRRCTLRPDWDEIKIDVMDRLLRRKFDPGSNLWHMLQATAPHELVEGNTWNDRFWGVCRGVGQNHLGRLLMAIRDDEWPSPNSSDERTA